MNIFQTYPVMQRPIIGYFTTRILLLGYNIVWIDWCIFYWHVSDFSCLPDYYKYMYWRIQKVRQNYMFCSFIKSCTNQYSVPCIEIYFQPNCFCISESAFLSLIKEHNNCMYNYPCIKLLVYVHAKHVANIINSDCTVCQDYQ